MGPVAALARAGDARQGVDRPRVLYFMFRYPNFSETYMHEEIRSVLRECDVRIISCDESNRPRRDPFKYEVLRYPGKCPVYARIDQVDRTFETPESQVFLRKIDAIVEEFRPDVLHAHYLGLSLLAREVAERHRLPFTLRTHSMDILSEPAEKLDALCEAARSPWCRRVLVFPELRRRLVRHGVPRKRAVACWPLFPFDRFYAPEPRPATGRVLCGGPATEKKAHHQFVDLAHRMRDSEFTFHLYARGKALEATASHNERLGSPVEIDYADPDDMPEVYRRHDWIVYTSDVTIHKVGLPISLVEAQASGLGIAWQQLPGRRRSQRRFLGGGGYLFRSIDEVPAILSSPYPEKMRRRGFENARKCDVEAHRHLLLEAWK